MQNVNPINNPESAIKSPEVDVFLQVLPVELQGKVDVTAWQNMNKESKLGLLHEHGLLTKYATELEKPVQVGTKVEVAPVMEGKIEGQVEVGGLGKEHKEFEQAVDELKSIEEEKPPVNVDEQARIDVEQASTATKKVKFFGYQPTPQIVNNAQQISDDDDVSMGKTWMATLVGKLFKLFS